MIFLLKTFLSYRPWKIVWADPPTAVRFRDNEDWVEVARGQFTDKGSDINITHLELRISFLQIKLSMTNKEKLRQIRSTICVNRR